RIERCDRDGADTADAESIAVACRIRDDLRTHDAAGARAIVHNHWLAQHLLDVTRGHPANQVRIASSRFSIVGRFKFCTWTPCPEIRQPTPSPWCSDAVRSRPMAN